MTDDPKPLVREPYVLAMIICDAAYIDPSTGKKSLLGMFSSVVTAELPAVVAQLVLYFAITDGHGEVPIKIRLVDAAESREPIFEIEVPANFPDPLAVHENIVVMRTEFAEAGEYRFQLFAGNHPLSERRILVIHKPAEGPKDER